MPDTKKFLDTEGVKTLYSFLSLQDYPNNETLIAVLAAIDESKANKNYETWTFTLADGSTVTKQVCVND